MPTKHHNQTTGRFLGTLLWVGVLLLIGGAAVVYLESEPGRRAAAAFAHSR